MKKSVQAEIIISACMDFFILRGYLYPYNMQPEPEKYNNWNKMQYSLAKNYFEEFKGALKLPKEHAMVMDIGCGSGNITNEVLFNILNKNVNLKKIIGTDINEEMIEFANARYLNKKLEFRAMNICTRELPEALEGKFDLVTAFSSFHWFPDQKLALKNIRRLLKPNGELFLMFSTESMLWNTYKRMKENPKWSSYIQNVSTTVDNCLPSSGDYFEFFRAEDFSIRSLRFEKHTFRYKNGDETRRMIEHLSHFKETIPEHLWSELIDDNFEVYKDMLKTQKEYNAADERDFPASRVIVHAIKL
ncbi:Juvenile hormone acid O-methyltransferase [Nymphon striatum]|nr:Juvenile hormone acid O-methyltransferase [Nymphon striatum]